MEMEMEMQVSRREIRSLCHAMEWKIDLTFILFYCFCTCLEWKLDVCITER